MCDSRSIVLSTRTVRAMDQDGIFVVEVTGEVDSANCGPLLAILAAQLDRRPSGLVADLTRTASFCPAGAKALVDTAELERNHGVAMAVAAPSALRAGPAPSPV